MADSDTLSDSKRKELDEHYKQNQDKLPECPTCNSKNDVIPAIRGKPTRDLGLYAAEGKVKLSGCMESYGGWCKKCEKFI